MSNERQACRRTVASLGESFASFSCAIRGILEERGDAQQGVSKKISLVPPLQFERRPRSVEWPSRKSGTTFLEVFPSNLGSTEEWLERSDERVDE
jgi:hypothetical protein